MLSHQNYPAFSRKVVLNCKVRGVPSSPEFFLNPDVGDHETRVAATSTSSTRNNGKLLLV